MSHAATPAIKNDWKTLRIGLTKTAIINPNYQHLTLKIKYKIKLKLTTIANTHPIQALNVFCHNNTTNKLSCTQVVASYCNSLV